MSTRQTLHAKTPAAAPAAALEPVAAAPAPAPEAPPARPQEERVLPAPTPELNPRNRMLAEIAARSNAAADQDASESIPPGDEDETVPPMVEPTEEPSEPAAPSLQATPETTPAAPASGIDLDREYEFIIDGQKAKIKGSQIVARVQKGETADHRLELASRLLQEAKQAAARQAAPPAQGAQPHAQAASQVQELKDEELAHLIQFGTKEQAAEAVRALRAQRPDAVTQQGFASFVAQLPSIVEARISFREGLDFAQKEYGDLLADPYLRPLFIMQEQEAMKAGDRRSKRELYKAIGDGLRQHFNRPAPTATVASAASAPTAQAAQTIAEKQAAKAAAPAAPKLASVRLDGGGGEKKPATREQILDGMRARRGQAQMSNR